MSKGLFVSATGTDTGKTYVTGLMIKLLRKYGINAGYYKPALSGAEFANGSYVPGDCLHVAKTAGIHIPPEELASFTYKTAASPHLAAKLEQRPIDTKVILADFAKLKQRFAYLAVEGCGGIVCPLRLDTIALMQTDIIKLLNLDILIIAPAGLGAINNVVLTAKYAENQNLTIKGIILNKYDQANFLHRDNKQTIECLTKLPVVACVAAHATDLAMEAAALCDLFKEV